VPPARFQYYAKASVRGVARVQGHYALTILRIRVGRILKLTSLCYRSRLIKSKAVPAALREGANM
jgi:hypothetical protein